MHYAHAPDACQILQAGSTVIDVEKSKSMYSSSLGPQRSPGTETLRAKVSLVPTVFGLLSVTVLTVLPVIQWPSDKDPHGHGNTY